MLAAPAGDPDHDYAPALTALARRSAAILPVAAELRALGLPLDTLLPSYVHMHVNRMIRSAPRAHELVLYDLLRRHYDSQIARAKRRAG